MSQNVAHYRHSTPTLKEYDMDESTIWWLLAGGTVGVELMLGTFYLLLVALGLAAAAIVAHLGVPMPAQNNHRRFGGRRCGGGVVLHQEKTPRRSFAPR